MIQESAQMLLHELKCKVCHRGEPALAEADIINLHRQIPKWEVKRVDGYKCLERMFTFKSFSKSMQFVSGVGKLAEAQNHHPLIVIDFDSVTLTWWTHKVKGLHLNDFIMAAKIDQQLQLFPLD